MTRSPDHPIARSPDHPIGHNPPVLLYRLLSTLTLLAYSPYALARSWTGRRRLGDVRGRLGRDSYPDLQGGIWLHAVSVGEVSAARGLLAALSRSAPGRRLGLSVTTAAGRRLAERTVADRIPVFSFPFELRRPIEKALSAVRPGLVLLTETELWPLFLEGARARGIPVALVNGRISERSFPRYRLVRDWFSRVLEKVTLFAMQTAEDAERIVFLGAPQDRVRVTGNIKYDLPAGPPFADAGRLRQAAAGRPMLVAASTADREEEIVLEAWKELDPRPLLAIAPRRPERFDEVARLIEASGLTLLRRSAAPKDGSLSSIHKSQITNHKSPPDIYLLDSIGELPSLYREARLAFVGGSLVPAGGHNPIEAWAEGVPAVVGPHTQNFREVCRRGERLGFLRRAKDGAELRQEFAAALADPARAAALGERARRFVTENRGASAATADFVLPLLESAGPCKVLAP